MATTSRPRLAPDAAAGQSRPGWGAWRDTALRRAAAAATAVLASQPPDVPAVPGGPPRLTVGEDALATDRCEHAARFLAAAAGSPRPALAAAIQQLLCDQPADSSSPHRLVLVFTRLLLALPAQPQHAAGQLLTCQADQTFISPSWPRWHVWRVARVRSTASWRRCRKPDPGSVRSTRRHHHPPHLGRDDGLGPGEPNGSVEWTRAARPVTIGDAAIVTPRRLS